MNEGDRCPHAGCDGNLIIDPPGECTCHITPPCWSCTEAVLVCDVCGENP